MDIISGHKVRKLRFFSSIRTKFALTFFSVTAVVLILMNTYFLTASRDMIFTSKQASIQKQAAMIATSLQESFETLTMEDVSKVMSSLVMSVLNVAGGTQLAVTDASGVIVYPETGLAQGGDYSVELLTTALEGNDVFYSKFTAGAFLSSAYTPVIANRGVIMGAVYVFEEDREQGKLLLNMQDTLKNISLIVAAFSVAMVAFIIWSVLRRITSIFKAIKSVREGEYNYRISMGGNDELALLGDEFNSLTDRLRETEEIRRRFVANASHELKTPLASIRLLSDSILHNEGMDPGTVREFISDIGDEAERLARTTEKLMTLARLDSSVLDEHTGIDMSVIVTGTMRLLKPLAESRGVTVTSVLGENCIVMATDDSLHTIAFNLAENAIKYNRAGGTAHVSLKREDDKVIFTVDDTGIGVPDEDIPHIFDRFYRVDKARSREAGGSGLGLSIVRDSVRELGGSVTAERLNGGGMRFQVVLYACGEKDFLTNDGND